MKPQVQEFESANIKTELPDFKSGDTLEVSFRIHEGEKERIQVFRGTVIQIRNAGMGKTVTLRKMSGNVAVERIFPLHSPLIAKIEKIKMGKVRQARLYYLRELQGKAARIRELRKTDEPKVAEQKKKTAEKKETVKDKPEAAAEMKPEEKKPAPEQKEAKTEKAAAEKKPEEAVKEKLPEKQAEKNAEAKKE